MAPVPRILNYTVHNDNCGAIGAYEYQGIYLDTDLQMGVPLVSSYHRRSVLGSLQTLVIYNRDLWHRLGGQ